MITTVRIAPIEQWCEHAKAGLGRNALVGNLVGMELQIETKTFEQKFIDTCDGPWWQLTPDSNDRLATVIDRLEIRGMRHHLCRHVLEMD